MIMSLHQGIDPDARDRSETKRAIKSLLADYQEQVTFRKVASRLCEREGRNKKFDEYSWSSVSPRSGGGMQLQIGTQSYGCVHFRKDFVGCLNCGLPSMARFRMPTIDEMVSQVDSALADNHERLVGVSHVCIQGDGSFLSPAEVPEDAVYAVAERLKKVPSIQTVTMETRLDFLSRDLPHILRVRSILAPGKRLEIAVGLESASEFVRNVIFRKGTSRKCNAQEHLIQLAEYDVDILLYVFVKPALLTEVEAIFDAIRTLFFVHELASGAPHVCWTAAVQPSFVQPGTFLEWRYVKGYFQPPFLWSISEILKIGAEGPAIIHLGSATDYPPPIAVAVNRKSDGSVCGCSGKFYEVLQQQYNRHGSIEKMIKELPRCECRSAWLKQLQARALTEAIKNLSDNRENLSRRNTRP